MNNCKICGKEYEKPKGYRYSYYCSGSCKLKAYRAKYPVQSLGQTPNLFPDAQPQLPNTPMVKEPAPPKAITPPMPPNMSDSAAFMVNWITRDRDRFEKLYNDERDTRKKIKEAKEALEKEFEKYKNDQALEKISNAKPSGLSGLSENPLVMKLIDHVGPALGKIAERFAEAGAATPATQLAGNDQGAINFAQWLSTKQPETQQYIVKMLMALSALPDENLLIQKIAQIENLVLGDYMRATG